MKRGRKPLLDRKRLIERLSARGWDQQRIARHLGCTRQNVSGHLRGRSYHVRLDVVCGACGETITTKAVFHQRKARVLCLPCLRNEPDPEFGLRLRSYRLAAGLNQRELAARIGISKASIRNYERRASPNWCVLSLLVQQLGPGLILEPLPPVRPWKKARNK